MKTEESTVLLMGLLAHGRSGDSAHVFFIEAVVGEMYTHRSRALR